MRELVREEIASARPERHSGRISAGKTAVAVELYLIEPFLAFGQDLNRSRVHRFEEVNPGFAQGIGLHKAATQRCLMAPPVRPKVRPYTIELYRASTARFTTCPVHHTRKLEGRIPHARNDTASSRG